MFRKASGFSWPDTKLVFDDHLSVIAEEGSTGYRYLICLFERTRNEFLRQSNILRHQDSEIKDHKVVVLGMRYNLKEALD